MPTLPADFPFQFRVSVANEDIQLITTSNTTVILNLIEIFELEEEIASELRVLLDSPSSQKRTVISMHNRPEKGQNYAYAALLECDLCGVQRGYFALFKSLSGDIAALDKECKEMHDFFNSELDRNGHFEKIMPKRSR
jgi:hypothetical protein